MAIPGLGFCATWSAPEMASAPFLALARVIRDGVSAGDDPPAPAIIFDAVCGPGGARAKARDLSTSAFFAGSGSSTTRSVASTACVHLPRTLHGMAIAVNWWRSPRMLLEIGALLC